MLHGVSFSNNNFTLTTEDGRHFCFHYFVLLHRISFGPVNEWSLMDENELYKIIDRARNWTKKLVFDALTDISLE
jgi:hypothetical protein